MRKFFYTISEKYIFYLKQQKISEEKRLNADLKDIESKIEKY
jgi:hypothetical protein